MFSAAAGTSLSLIIPIYQNAETILLLCEELEELEKCLSIESIDFSVSFVIDGSPDKSKDLLLIEKAKRHKINWKIISLSRNFGQTNALLAGLNLSKASLHVCMSADLQDPPNLIIDMVRSARDGNDIIIGVRRSREDARVRSLSSRIAYAFLRREAKQIPKGGFDYFLINENVRKNLVSLNGIRRFLQGDIAYLGFNVIHLPYHRSKRAHGKSAYTFNSRLKFFLDSLIDVSSGPLRIISLVGLLIALVGFGSALASIFVYFQGEAVFEGFTPIYVGILVFGGLQLLSIGVLGEYVMRLHDMARSRPPWIVKQID